MSNLATMIMEGSNYGFGRATLTHSYGHEDGAGLIAMESAEALRDIFEAEFYVPNTCTIAAALEGASCVEESSQAAIMEASLKGAFQKIKDFFIKLKEKVKDLIHNIIRYLKSIFMSDVKWVEQYEKELKALNSADLKGYEVKMYTYTIEEAMSKDALVKEANNLLSTTKDEVDKCIRMFVGNTSEDPIEEDKMDEECEKHYLDCVKEELGGKSVDEDEIQKALWSSFRNGADNESDKDDVSVGTNITKFIDSIKKSTKMLDAYNTAISKTDKMYNDAIKLVNDTESKIGTGHNITDKNGKERTEIKFADPQKFDTIGPNGEKGTGTNNAMYATSKQASNISYLLRKYSSVLSKMQSFKNSKYNAAKAAIVERNGAYKKALVGAFGYAKKNKKK